MAFQRVGILSIGEMGYHWARLLAGHGVEVLTYTKGRSDVTRRRADNAGARSVPSLARLVSESELVVSIVVPSAAKRVAAKVAKALLKAGRRDFLYLDANATSPMTAREIERHLSPSSANFVDGCIIGGAAKIGKGAVVYVSGPQAARLLALEESGLSVKVLGPEIAQASAFKIVYAGLTKGLQGLLVELLVGARKLGLLDEILQQYDKSFPGLVEKVGPSIAGLALHAARRAEEMDELKRTFRHYGLTAVMAPASEKLLKKIASLNAGEASDTGERKGDILETLELFFQRGLLQEK
ncbi:MAG: NAD(P)-dependent oxidoreductase [Deltaproteobacteria bacterium]|nr:NAD(P)-dependent oxidoreductase [Deltaproteobacteria bacterium]